jgi:hypothetical protein
MKKIKLYEIVYRFKVWANSEDEAKKVVESLVDFNKSKDFEYGDILN